MRFTPIVRSPSYLDHRHVERGEPSLAVAGVYFVAMALAPLFPGTRRADPEFEGVVPRRFGLNPQQFVPYVLGAFWAVGVILAIATSSRG